MISRLSRPNLSQFFTTFGCICLIPPSQFPNTQAAPAFHISVYAQLHGPEPPRKQLLASQGATESTQLGRTPHHSPTAYLATVQTLRGSSPGRHLAGRRKIALLFYQIQHQYREPSDVVFDFEANPRICTERERKESQPEIRENQKEDRILPAKMSLLLTMGATKKNSIPTKLILTAKAVDGKANSERLRRHLKRRSIPSGKVVVLCPW